MKRCKQKVLSGLLVMILALSCFLNYIPACHLPEKVEAAEQEDSYTYLSFHDYEKLNGEELTSPISGGTTQATTRMVSNLNKVVFSGELTFSGVGTQNTTVVRIGGNLDSATDYTWHGIGLYTPDGTTLNAYNYYTGTNTTLSTFTEGKAVKVSMKFDKVADNKWSVAYTVNGVYATTVDYTQTQNFGRYILISPGENSIGIASTDELNPVEQIDATAYNLEGGAYLVTGDCTITNAKGETVDVDPSIQSLNMPGDYTVLKKMGSFQREQKVSLYKIGDVNCDNSDEPDSGDLAALEKLYEKIVVAYKPDCASEYAADLDNDGLVGVKDLQIMKEILDPASETTLATTKEKYQAPAVTFDYIGGNDVMPIVGFYGPYQRDGYGQINDSIYDLLEKSGINIINYTWNGIGTGSSNDPALNAIELAEQHGLAYFVNDYNINPERNFASGNLVNFEDAPEKIPSMEQVADWYGKYSYYGNVLGVTVVDEVFPNAAWWEHSRNSYKTTSEPKQLKYYDWTSSTLNQYANTFGFINLINPRNDEYYENLGGTKATLYGVTEGRVSYEDFIEILKEKANVKMLSYTDYPFSSDWSLSDTAKYFGPLNRTSKAAKSLGIPFWGYVGAGGDFRDNDTTGAKTDEEKLPTEAELYWEVNTLLAFGAKGIEWFPVVQPHNYSNWDKDGDGTLESDDHDPDRNGLIGIDGTPTPFYDYAQKIHQHIEVIDEVLMKSNHIGIMASGSKTQSILSNGGVTVNNSVGSLQKVEDDKDNSYGALVGCFEYRDTEAFYVMNFDTGAKRTITLTFDGDHNYYVVNPQNYDDNAASGTTLTLELGAGEGALVVLEEDCSEHLVHFPGSEATSIEEGTKEYYVCSECDKLYADENAQEEITDASSLVIPALGIKQYTVNLKGDGNRFLYNAEETDKGVVITYTVKKVTGTPAQNGVIASSAPDQAWPFGNGVNTTGQLRYNNGGAAPTMLEEGVTYKCTIFQSGNNVDFAFEAITADGQSHEVNIIWPPNGTLDIENATFPYFGLWLTGNVKAELINVSCVELGTGRDLGLATNQTADYLTIGPKSNEYTVNLKGNSSTRFLYNADKTDKGVVITYTVKKATGTPVQNGVVQSSAPNQSWPFGNGLNTTGQLRYNNTAAPNMLVEGVTYKCTIFPNGQNLGYEFEATTADGQEHKVNIVWPPYGSLDTTTEYPYFGLWLTGDVEAELINVSCVERGTGRDLGLATNQTADYLTISLPEEPELEVDKYTVNLSGDSSTRFLYNADKTDKGVVITYTVKKATGTLVQNGVIASSAPNQAWPFGNGLNTTGQLRYNNGVDPTMLVEGVTYKCTIFQSGNNVDYVFEAITADGQEHKVNIVWPPAGTLDIDNATFPYFGLWLTGDVEAELINVSCVERGTGRNLGLATNQTAENLQFTSCIEAYTASDFSDYRSGAQYTAPEKEGYVFAGWYGDNTCTKPVSAKAKWVVNSVYAKFVQKDVLSTKGQFSKDLTSAETSTTALRLVTTVDCDDYTEVGFKVISGTRSEYYKDITAYKKITGFGQNMSFTYVPTDISERSVAFVTVVLDGIVVAGKDVNREFKVQAYWKTSDGTTVYGGEKTITIQMGIDVNNGNTGS